MSSTIFKKNQRSWFWNFQTG